MIFIDFLISAFITACIFIAGMASTITGCYVLADKRGWYNKVLGLMMIIIPFTLLITSSMYSEYQRKHQNKQVQVEERR